MTDEEISTAKHGPVLHFPTVLGAVVVTYNLPEVTAPLRLPGRPSPTSSRARSRSGTMRASPRSILRSSSPRRTSSSCIAPTAAARPTSSPTTSRSASTTWTTPPAARQGQGSQVAGWTGRQGERRRRRPGEADAGSIGYVELAYAKQNKLPDGRIVKNAGGRIRRADDRHRSPPPPKASSPRSRRHRLSHLDRECAGRRCVSHLVVHLAPRLPEAARRGQGEEARRLHAVDVRRRDSRARRALDYAPLPGRARSALTDRLATIQR